jgi:SRSO17 transposase
MQVQQIKTMGCELNRFLRQYDDCFGRSEPRGHLRTYIRGQLSDLPRKSVEPIALAAGTPPRTLQRFLSIIEADDERIVNRTQQIVAREHADPWAIGTVDDTGNPKKGRHTAGVQRQWCGNAGKIDNCVVSVHIGYSVGDFHCLLDSDVYLPESWSSDPARRAEAGVPDDVAYRKKTDIALGQVDRAMDNGVRVRAWTFDEGYGRDGSFLDGLNSRGQNYVGEVPSDFTGWVRRPRVLTKARPQEARKRGRKRVYPRLARQGSQASEVQHLASFSKAFRKRAWVRFKIKDGEKGPVVWEAKFASFYRKHDDDLPGPEHTLIVARNVLNPDEVKYFVSNWILNAGATKEEMLRVAFSRWPIERCFELSKRDIGMDHFEARSWRAIHRHLYISQLSLLFCAQVQRRLREKNDGQPVPDGRTGATGRQRLDHRPAPAAAMPPATLPTDCRTDRLLSTPQSSGEAVSYKTNPARTAKTKDQRRSITLVHTG